MKKKLLYLLMTLVMCVSLTACGGGSSSSTAPASNDSSDSSGDDLQVLTDAYNKVVDAFNDVADKAEANGWMNDEETAATLEAITATMTPIGEALSKGPSAMADSDIPTLTEAMQELLPELEEMSKKVSVPYGDSAGEDAAAGGDLDALTNAFNQVATLYNEVTITADENGWGADEETVTMLDAISAMLEPVGSALEDPSALSDAEITALTEAMQDILDAGVYSDLEEMYDQVSVPYEG